jgi:glycosyltransferase involved in cell wall biosynthesis
VRNGPLNILEVAGKGNVGVENMMGPVTRGLHELSVEFAAMGHGVTVVDGPAIGPRTLPPPIVLREISAPAPRGRRGDARNWWDAAVLVRRVLAAVDARAFDVVHCHNWQTAWLLSKRIATPVVYTCHTADWAVRDALEQRSRLRRLRRRFILHEEDAIRSVAATVSLGAFLKQSVPGATIEVIPYGSRARWASMPSRSEARSRLGVGQSTFVTLTVARRDRNKGLETLIDAVRSLPPDYGEAWIVGGLGTGFPSAAEAERYGAKLGERASGLPIRFLGALRHGSEEFMLRTAAADLYVQPSLLENQGVAALEAMFAGLPVLASDVGGLSDLVGGAGLLVPPRDPAALAAALIGLKDDPSSREACARACLERSRQYEWHAIADRYLALFRKVIAGRAGASA